MNKEKLKRTLSKIIPLSDHLDFESPIFKVSDHIYKGTYWKGKHYGLRYSLAVNASSMIFYNRQLTSREGQPDILDLIENNQWTWAAMEEIAINCTRDANGDGIIEQYGIFASSDWQFLKYMLYSNGTVGIDLKDGKLQYLMDEPRSLRAIQYSLTLAFVDKVYTRNKTLWENGNVAIRIHSALGENTPLLNKGMESIIGVLPMGVDVNEYQNVGNQNPIGMSSLCEYKPEIAKLMAELFVTWDENGDDCEALAKVKESIAPDSLKWDPTNTASRRYTSEREFLIQKKVALKYVPDFVDGIDGLGTYLSNNLCTPIFKGEKTVTQAVDSIKYYIQSNYLDPYNK